MERRGRRLAAALLVVSALLPVVPAAATPDPAAEAGPRTTAAVVAAALDEAAPDLASAAVGETVAGRLLVTFRADVDADTAARILADAGLPTTVVPGFTVQVVDLDGPVGDDALLTLASAPEVVDVAPDRKLDVTPSQDPLRADQWWWQNRRQEVRGTSGVRAGRPSIDVGVPQAWRATKGRADVVVAIVDTGLDISHPDLRGNLWRNPRPGRFPGCTNDVHGCNLSGVGSSHQVYANAQDDAHGTHVAGIIAAAEDDVGIVGIAPRVQLMSVKFLRGTSGSLANGVRAIQYAVSSGADVINASWGVPGRVTSQDLASCRPGDTARNCTLVALERTIRDARVPVVTAAGNGGTDLDREPEFPASSQAPNVITVTAVDNRGDVPPFANVSTTLVDVAAPGMSVLSTLPEGRWGEVDGTSQAAPMVTGTLALAISRTGVRDGARLAAAVRAGARPFGHLGDRNRPSGLTRAGLLSAPGTLQALGVELGACPGTTPRASFPDVGRRDVHTPNIDCVVARGLATGYRDGTYRPTRTVTRGQVATLLAGLVRTAEDLPVPRRGRFNDLRGDVHRDNIEALAALGIVDGYRDGRYHPARPVTREQFASLLTRTYEHLVRGSVRPDGARFPDVGGVHERAVRVGAHLGFIEGRRDGRFAPREGVTRAQLASLTRRALDKLVADRVSEVG